MIIRDEAANFNILEGEIMAIFEYTTKVEIMKALLEILKELKAIRKAMETKKN